MNRVRLSALAAFLPASLICLILAGCSGLMTSVGGGMTPELEASGVSAPAEILEVWDTGWTINDNPVIGMKVRVRPADRPDFEATIEKTTISRIAVPQFQPGNLIPVRFDPRDPASIAVDPGGDPSAASVPSSGNPYHDRFERAEIVGAAYLPPPAEPAIYLGTGDMRTDIQTLFENGYALLGGSGVRNATNPELALEQGREIGAALVVVYGHFVAPPDLALDVLPFARRPTVAGQVQAATPADALGMRLVSGGLGPEDQFATYWGLTRPPILGIVSRPLDAREQARLARRDGIVVESVSSGSPAEAAGIAIGDIVVAIDGRPLPDARAVPELITSLAGREVKIELIRGAGLLTLTVPFNAAMP